MRRSFERAPWITMPKREFTSRQTQREAEIVERHFVREIDESAELAALVDGHAVVAAVPVEPDRDVINHLRESERDHDEIDAARAQAKRTDRQREQCRSRERQRPLQQA